LSVLADLPGFNSIFGYPIDYLHQLLEGITSTMISLLCDGPQNSQKYWKNHKYDVSTLNRRIKEIRPPRDMSAEPKEVTSLSEWKSKDFRLFLLFILLPAFCDLLGEAYYRNLKDLVIASYILLSDSISREQLREAERLLQEFERRFNLLYGSASVTYNLHLCTHLCRVVQFWGSLYGYSTMVFESGNSHMGRLVKGTTGVVTQIARKHLSVQCVSNAIHEHPVSKKVLTFCSDIMNYRYAKPSTTFDDSIRACGNARLVELSEDEVCAATAASIFLPSNSMSAYRRVVKDNVVFYSASSMWKNPKQPNRTNQFDDTCVSLSDNSFAVIENFVQIPDSTELFMFVKPIRVATEGHLAPHIFTCAADMFAPLKLVQCSTIFRKCARITFKNGSRTMNFVSPLPNMIEKD